MRDEIMEKINASDNEIDLIEMKITDEEIEEIANFIVENKPLVEKILLGGNYLSDEGAIILQRTFSNLKNLSLLEIQLNQIDIQGLLALDNLIQINPRLRLPIFGNKITDAKVIDEIRKGTFKLGRSLVNP